MTYWQHVLKNEHRCQDSIPTLFLQESHIPVVIVQNCRLLQWLFLTKLLQTFKIGFHMLLLDVDSAKLMDKRS